MAQLTGTKVLFSDNFTTLGPDNKLDAAKWGFNQAWYGNNGKNNPAYLGDITLMRQELPQAENGTARIRLDTWNADWKNGTSLYGSEAITKDAWDAQSTGGVAFQARMKFEGTQGGMIAGLFFYQQFGFPPSPSDPRVPHNELDWEILTSQLKPSSKNKISTNVFTHGPGAEKDYPKSWPVTQIPNFSPNDYHTYRVEWLPTKVIWKIDGKTIRTEETNLPQANVKEQLHLNLWGVPTFWGPSAGDAPPVWPTTGPNLGDPTFVPATNANPYNATTNPGGNKTFYLDVRDVKVEQLSTRLGNSGANALVGGASNDGIDGGAGNDTLAGGAGDDTIWGDAGDDKIIGGTGADDMSGGTGNDLIYVDNARDQVFEDVGGGNDRVLSSVDYTLAAGQEIELLTTNAVGVAPVLGTSAINLTGNEFAQTIWGNAGANVLNGAGGDDVLYGFGGHDTLIGGPGADRMAGGPGNDLFYVDNAADEVIEDIGGGNDRVLASVDYTLAAGQEIETLGTNAAGVEPILGTDPINLTGNEFAQTIEGNAAANVLNGAGGDDVLYGFGGNDTLIGGPGNDTLIGGAGADLLQGGDGADRFVFSTALGAGNVDTVADFVHGPDSLRLSSDIFGLPPGALSADSFKDVALAPLDANDRIIYNSNNGNLFFDPDGSGGAPAVQFATVTDHPLLASNDFRIG